MPVKLVLTMIVKNEGKIIGRCLDAALPHCAGYVITDTGSTDDTKAQIAAAALRHGAAGWVVDEKWKNFGHNRTLSAQAARQYVRAQELDAGRTYLLFLDGDMELEVDSDFDRESLTLPSYDLYQVQPGSMYPNTRLGRADIDWRSAGVTHEWWVPGPGGSVGHTLERGMRIQDRNDGGAKADKFPRDAALLEEGLKEEPKNERYMFYLANTYYDMGRYADALGWYEKRRVAGGFYQEVWYSLFKKGQCQMHLGDAASADTMLEAYNERPQRAEPLFYLAQHYRGKGKNHAAMLLTDQIGKMPLPGGGELFLEHTLYGGAPLSEEIAINAWHVGKHDVGEREAEAIARGRGRPSEAYEQASRHLSHYARPLERVMEGRFVVPEGLRRGYSNSSPTIVEHGGELLVHCRLVNYHHEKGYVFQSRDPDNVIRTRGALTRWRPGTEEKLEWQEVVTEFPEDWSAQGIRVLGAEDQRWVSHKGRLYLTANTWQQSMHRDWPQMVLGRVHESLTKIDEWWGLPSPTGSKTEKNWLPWSRDDELFLVYGYDPFQLVHMNFKTGAVQKALEHQTPFASQRLRGSAGPVAHPEKPGASLVMVHEKAIFAHEHVYMQRLIELDAQMRPVAMSVPFYIDHRGVEFPLGFMHYEDKALITYGREERESCYAIVEWKELLSRFR